jgi:hypothetical protein
MAQADAAMVGVAIDQVNAAARAMVGALLANLAAMRSQPGCCA